MNEEQERAEASDNTEDLMMPGMERRLPGPNTDFFRALSSSVLHNMNLSSYFSISEFLPLFFFCFSISFM